MFKSQEKVSIFFFFCMRNQGGLINRLGQLKLRNDGMYCRPTTEGDWILRISVTVTPSLARSRWLYPPPPSR